MDLICKFVFKNGKEIGESIDVFDGYLIVKRAEEFFGVPLSAIRDDGERITISDFDEMEGKKIGEKWIAEKSKPISIEELEKYGFGRE